jgi:hypothetical protein
MNPAPAAVAIDDDVLSDAGQVVLPVKHNGVRLRVLHDGCAEEHDR